MTVQAATLPLDQAELLPTSAMSEAQLVRGYSRVARPQVAIEQCACREAIVAISRADDDVQLAVAAHVRTIAHRAYSARLARDREA